MQLNKKRDSGPTNSPGPILPRRSVSPGVNYPNGNSQGTFDVPSQPAYAVPASKVRPGAIVTPKGPRRQLFQPLEGSRLAVVLHEIARRFKGHPLEDMAYRALSGGGDINATLGGTDVYTKIRDTLIGFDNGDEADRRRANEIAKSYNWHRVGKGLALDEMVRTFTERALKSPTGSSSLRHAHNLFGIGSQERQQNGFEQKKYNDLLARNPQMREQFWNGLHDYVGRHAGTYGLSSNEMTHELLEKSLRRQAENEENLHGGAGLGTRLLVTGNRPLATAGESKVREVAPEQPAWTQTAAGNIRARPTARAGQYRRKREGDES